MNFWIFKSIAAVLCQRFARREVSIARKNNNADLSVFDAAARLRDLSAQACGLQAFFVCRHDEGWESLACSLLVDLLRKIRPGLDRKLHHDRQGESLGDRAVIWARKSCGVLAYAGFAYRRRKIHLGLQSSYDPLANRISALHHKSRFKSTGDVPNINIKSRAFRPASDSSAGSDSSNSNAFRCASLNKSRCSR